ncbi:uncharacterized protein LOC111336296 isoform X2 [Stylophora pistillata]|uniref:uncharacterized protein LOC111336296 isoform X2 n=1 Tax=Stylophora pistillata TaxID=50429 RepID=UPI000C053F48|nr:uncharacterized protein LOC111336296 isoform X2 [Stylophora pistillata]
MIIKLFGQLTSFFQQRCPDCSFESPIARKQCKNAGCLFEFKKKEKDWECLHKMGKVNPTIQRELLEKRADILHVKSGFDVAVFYRAKHGTGKSFYYYGTPGLGEEFLRSNSDFAPTVKDMFEAFSVQYGPPPTKASPQDPQPPSDCPSAEASDLEHQQPSNCPSSQVPASATASPADSPQTNNYPSSQVLAPAIASHPDSPPTLQPTNCPSSQGIDVVLYSVEGQAVAVGYMECDRQFLLGKCILSGYKVVRLRWVNSSDIPALLVLGDPDENFFLSSGQFFALSIASLKLVKLVR